MMRPLEAWLAAALALVVVAIGAGLLAHGIIPHYTVLWWVPLWPAAAALLALVAVWLSAAEQRAAVNRQRLAVDAQRAENDRSQ